LGYLFDSPETREGNKNPELKKIGFVETLSFQQIVEHQFAEGTVPVPRTALALFRLCCITFSGVIAPGGCHSGGDRGVTLL